MNRLSIACDGSGPWWLDGDCVGETRSFPTLCETLACARELTGSGETLIELRISGFYACVHQERGWPRRIQPPAKAAA